MSSIYLPPGWLPAALRTDASLQTLRLARASTAPVGIDPQTAWDQFRSLQLRERALIRHENSTYDVRDVERTADGILHYAFAQNAERQSGRWAVFFQENPFDEEPEIIPPKTLRELLLEPYLDPDLMIQPEEITWPDVVSRSPIVTVSNGVLKQTLLFQNQHSVDILWKPQGSWDRKAVDSHGHFREIWQAGPETLEKALLKIPLPALTQIDEVRLRTKYHPMAHGQTLREGNRRIVNLFPNDVTPETAASHRLHSSGKRDESAHRRLRNYLFLYGILHEILGHGLMTNRFLKREIIKIMAAEEPPPTPYALEGLDEWFAEGAAVYWTARIYEDAIISTYETKFPLLLGLIRHALACLEDTVEPANKNMALWTQRILTRPKIR